MADTWTTPYCGVQHLGSGPYRVSVTDHDTFADLSCWYPGCGFNPVRSQHDTIEDARAAGEKWLASSLVAPSAEARA